MFPEWFSPMFGINGGLSVFRISLGMLGILTVFNFILFMETIKHSSKYKEDGTNQARIIFNVKMKDISERVPSTPKPSVKSTVSHVLFNHSCPTKHQPTSSLNKALPLCPEIPPNLPQHRNITQEERKWSVIEDSCRFVKKGGRNWSTTCRSRWKVAIIIPYRNRENHLKIFLNYLHPFLKDQLIDYGIFLVEQADGMKFNRGMLLNIGFVESQKMADYDCFIFHDVDLLPEVSKNMYVCAKHPRHLSVAIDKFKYRLPYGTIFGGVTALTKEQFQKVNGYSNTYFGWGGEDDDMYKRLKKEKMPFQRPGTKVGRYTMIKHKREEKNPKRINLLRNGMASYKTVGLNSLKYKVLTKTCEKLYTRFVVEIRDPSIAKHKKS